MSLWRNQRVKPVIGLAGGIGAGKSTIARLFATEGCAVIDSDTLAHSVLQSDAIRGKLRAWLGTSVFLPDGSVNRKAVARAVFGEAERTARLNSLIHPLVDAERNALMEKLLSDARVRAIVWDSPLLFESGLNAQCDRIVFVDAPVEIRYARVRDRRGWTPEELVKREKLQFALDKKAALADYIVNNSGDEAHSLRQVQQVLSQLFV